MPQRICMTVRRQSIHISLLFILAHVDPPLAPLPNRPDLKEFVGEETHLPTPPVRSRTASDSHSPFQSAGLGNAQPDPSVWSEEQQQQLMSALMGGLGRAPPNFPGQPRLPSSSASEAPSDAPNASPPEDPLAAMIAAMTQQQQGGGQAPMGGFPGMNMEPPAPRPPKTLLQKVMPVVHLVAAWFLFAYFFTWREPLAYELQSHGSVLGASRWRRWAELAWKSPVEGWGVQAVVRSLSLQ